MHHKPRVGFKMRLIFHARLLFYRVCTRLICIWAPWFISTPFSSVLQIFQILIVPFSILFPSFFFQLFRCMPPLDSVEGCLPHNYEYIYTCIFNRNSVAYLHDRVLERYEYVEAPSAWINKISLFS